MAYLRVRPTRYSIRENKFVFIRESSWTKKIRELVAKKIMEDKEKQRLPDDDWVVYLPDEAMRSFNSAYFKMLQARQELQNVADELKRIEN